jgi:hypothetical protein
VKPDRPFTSWVVGAIVGAMLGLAAVTVRYDYDPAFTVDMDRNASTVIPGLHEVERVGEETYAWTRGGATMTLRELDRDVDWTCTIRLKGGREDTATLPEVVVAVDGLITATAQTTNEYQDVHVSVPARAGASGARIGLTASTTFVPGPGDRRTLGIMIDRWTCAPAAAAFLLPPQPVMTAAAAGGAAFGLAFAVLGAGILATIGGAALLAVAQAVPLGWEFGVFTLYPRRALGLALSVAAVLVLVARATEWAIGRRVSTTGRLVVACTAALLYLKLLALAHPGKLPIDIVFHAHRLQWVLDGRFYFTQPMPGGVHFPYAIGLYVFAAPWSVFTTDYGLLLRVVVATAEAVGAILVYVAISRIWRDPFAATTAAILFHLVPRTFNILHNANMTNAFGQTLAFAALAAAVLWRLDSTRAWQTAGLTVLIAWALLSHVSTFTSLAAILVTLVALYWFRGGPQMHRPAITVLAALVVAAGFAVVLYYGWFGDAYRSAARIRAAGVGVSATAEGAAATAAAQTAPASGLPAKLAQAGALTVAAVGWPIAILGLIGAVPFWRLGRVDRLSLAVIALVLNYAVFVSGVVVVPVERSFQRYAAEFISRVTLATYPSMVILAGLGAAWMWRASPMSRLFAGGLLVSAGWVGIQNWINWLR